MSELQTAREKMEAKLARKKELLVRLHVIQARSEPLRGQLHAQGEKLRRLGGTYALERLQAEAEKLEFSIATSAYTPAQEKELLKRMHGVQERLGAAKEKAKGWEESQKWRAELSVLLGERDAIRKELDGLRVELEALYQVIIRAGSQEILARREQQARTERKKEWAERDVERRKQRREEHDEMAPYLKDSHDSHVSLEEIAVIKKKPAPESAGG